MSAIVGFGFGSSPGRRASIGVVVACGIVVASLLAGLVLGVLGARFGPTVVVGLPLAGFWLAAALARPVWAIVPVMLVLPVSLGAGDVGPLALLDVAVLGAVGLTTVVALSRPASLRLALPPGLLWGGAVCALGVPALALAVDTERATRHFLTIVLAFLFAVAVVAACTRLRDVRLLVATFLVVGAVMCGASLSGASEVESSFGGAVVDSRPTGFFGQPNELGSFAAMVLMVALGVALARLPAIYRLGALVTAALASAALALSLSRGAWIGAGLGVVALLVLVPRTWRILAVVAIVGVILGFSVGNFGGDTPAVEVVRDRFGTVLDPADNPYDNRPLIWDEALRQIEDRPLFGFGPANFPIASSRSRADFSVDVGAVHAHNALLTVGAELGVLAVVAVIGFTIAVGLAVRRAVRLLRARPESRIAAGIGAGLVTVVGHGLLDYPLRNGVLMVTAWFLTGLAIGLDQIARAGPGVEDGVRREPSAVGARS